MNGQPLGPEAALLAVCQVQSKRYPSTFAWLGSLQRPGLERGGPGPRRAVGNASGCYVPL